MAREIGTRCIHLEEEDVEEHRDERQDNGDVSIVLHVGCDCRTYLL